LGIQQVARIDAFTFRRSRSRWPATRPARRHRQRALFRAGFDDFDAKLGDATFDLVCFFGSLHHVREIDTVLTAVHRRLTPGGKLIFNEYTGDCYTILDEHKAATINRLLETIDPAFLNSDRPRYINPTLDAMLTGDPSEGVRAALILPFLRHRFEIEVLRPFGGAVLHMLYRSPITRS
jgi:SAM-dependent methyltransferase